MGPLLYQESDRAASQLQPGRCYGSGHLREKGRRDTSVEESRPLTFLSPLVRCKPVRLQLSMGRMGHVGQLSGDHERVQSYTYTG